MSTFFIAMIIVFVLFSPLLIWSGTKGRRVGLSIWTFPWFPAELRALWARPRTDFTRRLVRSATRRW
ncbi:MAG TPA: hypothetical protein VGX23_01570 [Actinocrinis sp.]|nr:hypothetical protein [Actinocrinis sp.]